MKAIKDPQTQECLKAAFHGEIPKDLSAETLKKAQGVFHEATGDGGMIHKNDVLLLNQIMGKLKTVLDKTKPPKKDDTTKPLPDLPPKKELYEDIDFEQLLVEVGLDEDFAQIDLNHFFDTFDNLDLAEIMDYDRAEELKGVMDSIKDAGHAVAEKARQAAGMVKESFTHAGDWILSKGKALVNYLKDPNVQMCIK